MGRQFGAALGLIAFGVSIIRGILYGVSAEATLLQACVSLFGYSLLGFGIGLASQWMVREFVEKAFYDKLAAMDQEKQTMSSERTATDSSKNPLGV